MPGAIIVINPNSTEAVTRAMDDGLARLRLPGGPEIRCQTLHEGPPGIESQRDADSVILPLCRSIAAQEEKAAAFVIACFSDPGLFSAREVTRRPVFGIAECGILTALTLGHRFGVIAILAGRCPGICAISRRWEWAPGSRATCRSGSASPRLPRRTPRSPA